MPLAKKWAKRIKLKLIQKGKKQRRLELLKESMEVLNKKIQKEEEMEKNEEVKQAGSGKRFADTEMVETRTTPGKK